MPILQDLWNLRTDPFFPEVDANGEPLPREALEQTLDPQLDARVLRYYFDVYDWSASQFIRGLSSETAVQIFPEPRDLPQNSALMVLISGSMQTGRDSLANLLVHKINHATTRTPLVVELELDGPDISSNLRSLAMRFIFAFEHDSEPLVNKESVVKQMWDVYERVTKQEEGRRNPTYSTLFLSLRELFRQSKRPLVFRIAGGGDNDTWGGIYDATKSLCSYLLVLTHDGLYAKTCYDAMIGSNKNVSWIRATQLNRDAAVLYLAQRLQAERIAESESKDPLRPFTQSAIDALYEKGSNAKPQQVVTYSIGWLRRTLGRALRDYAKELQQAIQDNPQQALLDPMMARIDPVRLRAAREQLNQGG